MREALERRDLLHGLTLSPVGPCISSVAKDSYAYFDRACIVIAGRVSGACGLMVRIWCHPWEVRDVEIHAFDCL
jgi:hypothetical protein